MFILFSLSSTQVKSINTNTKKNDFFCKTCSDSNSQFCTIWTPLCDLPDDNYGRLAIIPGSHRLKGRNYLNKEEVK